MLFSTFPHILGAACVLYALQLARYLFLELRGRDLAICLMTVAAGFAALTLAVTAIIAFDSVFPLGGVGSDAAFFIRVAILVPTSYLAVFFFSSIVSRLIGDGYPAGAVSGVALLGLTLMVLAPVAVKWHAALFPQPAG